MTVSRRSGGCEPAGVSERGSAWAVVAGQHLERSAILLAPLITALITTLLPGVQA
jgi:hypothetical protein